MRFVIQRVMHSKVTINGEVRGQIGKGFMVLIGVGEEDTVEIADKMIHKMVNMRIFEDENGKTNLGLKGWAEVFCLFPSSHYMLTVKEETDLPL